MNGCARSLFAPEIANLYKSILEEHDKPAQTMDQFTKDFLLVESIQFLQKLVFQMVHFSQYLVTYLSNMFIPTRYGPSSTHKRNRAANWNTALSAAASLELPQMYVAFHYSIITSSVIDNTTKTLTRWFKTD